MQWYAYYYWILNEFISCTMLYLNHLFLREKTKMKLKATVLNHEKHVLNHNCEWSIICIVFGLVEPALKICWTIPNGKVLKLNSCNNHIWTSHHFLITDHFSLALWWLFFLKPIIAYLMANKSSTASVKFWVWEPSCCQHFVTAPENTKHQVAPGQGSLWTETELLIWEWHSASIWIEMYRSNSNFLEHSGCWQPWGDFFRYLEDDFRPPIPTTLKSFKKNSSKDLQHQFGSTRLKFHQAIHRVGDSWEFQAFMARFSERNAFRRNTTWLAFEASKLLIFQVCFGLWMV